MIDMNKENSNYPRDDHNDDDYEGRDEEVVHRESYGLNCDGKRKHK